jgi:hypothetical protein
MSRIVDQPRAKHACPPARSLSGAWREYDSDSRQYVFQSDPTGTVRACECGKTWVSTGGRPGLLVALWRPEGRFERWRRERRYPW